MFKKIIEYFRSRRLHSYDKCYSEREKNGEAIFCNCSGLAGGTSNTEHLQEGCIDCPYLVI